MSIKTVKLLRVDLRRGAAGEVDDEVAVDEAVCIFVNDEHYRTLIATPTMKRELVVGHLIGEGAIRTVEEVSKLEINPPKVNVFTRENVDLEFLRWSRRELLTTACGSPTTDRIENQMSILRVSSDVKIEAEKVREMAIELNRRSLIFRRTGGTHSSMLCSLEGSVLAFAEDVGRHNAVDKVLGAGSLNGHDLSRCILVCSGRQSSEIVLKAAASGIPVIATVAGPLKSGIRVAKAVGITLICFVRGRRMNVYTHPQRLVA